MEKKNTVLRKLFIFTGIGMLAALLFSMSASAATYAIPRANKVYTLTEASGINYYRITIKQDSVLGISAAGLTSGGDAGAVKIGLLNSKKKALEKYYHTMSDSNGYAAYYGVKKGTYYIIVNSDYSKCRIKYAVTAVSENSGSAKSKAKLIKRGVLRNGLVAAGESGKKSDWYKFRVVNKASFTVNLDSLTNGGQLVVQVLAPRYNMSRTYYCASGAELNKTYQLMTNGKYTGSNVTATVYVRVFRRNYNSSVSGAYTLSWK